MDLDRWRLCFSVRLELELEVENETEKEKEKHGSSKVDKVVRGRTIRPGDRTVRSELGNLGSLHSTRLNKPNR